MQTKDGLSKGRRDIAHITESAARRMRSIPREPDRCNKEQEFFPLLDSRLNNYFIFMVRKVPDHAWLQE